MQAAGTEDADRAHDASSSSANNESSTGQPHCMSHERRYRAEGREGRRRGGEGLVA